MTFLSGIAIRKQISECQISVTSLDPKYPFEADQQVTEDSIDLRLSPFALRYKPGLKSVDYLHENLPELYESVVLLPEEGYEIQPGDVLFGQTLEAITFPDTLLGLVFTRSTYARLGLTVTCGAAKFAAGISWAFPLQIANCSAVAIRIYPYSILAQLMVSPIQGAAVGYQGRYQNTFQPLPPVFNEREKNFLKTITLDSRTRTLHILQKEVDEQKAHILQKARESQEISANKAPIPEKNPTVTRIIRVLLALAGTFCIGVAGNLLAADTPDYWRSVSMILFTVLGLIGVFISIFFVGPDRSGATDLNSLS